MRRKIQEENIRKIAKIGNYSLGITFPRSVLASLGWKERQRVVVKKKGTKLIISDFKEKRVKK